MNCTRLGSLSVTSLNQVPSKEHTSRECIRSANGCLHTSQKRVTYCCHPSPFLSCAGCYTGSRSGCLAHLQHLSWYDGSFLFSLPSSEAVLKRHLRLQRKSLPPSGPCRCNRLFFRIIGPPPFCVCWWWSFWLFGHGLWAHCRLHLEPAI